MRTDRDSSDVVPMPRALHAVDAGPGTILLVAIPKLERERLSAFFREQGYCVLWAPGESEALTICALEHPDCIVLDVSSRDAGDLRVCRALRDLACSADATILCLSARKDEAAVDSALLAGADEVLEKPLTPEQLLAHVQAASLPFSGMSESAREYCQRMRQQRLRIGRLQRHRERVSAFIVHDLKQPLSAIELRTALLLLDGDMPEAARISIERVRTLVRSAQLQVLNLLDIRLLDEGHLAARYEAVDLHRMVRELLTDFDVKAKARALTLHSDIDVPQVIADPDLLRRVLANLLDNALRHAPNNSEVAVTAHRIAGARIELRVLDAGGSIPQDMNERIFEAFVQVEPSGAPEPRRTGRGLGLAFCKLAVEAHHGEIGVAKIDNRTVFSVKLPEMYMQQGA